MNFALFGSILLVCAALNHSFEREIRIDRRSNGIDHFQIFRDNGDNLCASSAKTSEFCAKYRAIHVKNPRVCREKQGLLHCRCNSTKSTFLLNKEMCAEGADVTRYLYSAGAFKGCQNHLVVQDGGAYDAYRRCERPPYPTLLTNTNNTRRFSVCSAQASQEVISCSPEMRNSRYFDNGQWKKMWEIESRQTESSKSSLEKELIKLSSKTSRWKGYLVYIPANCQVRSEISLRGAPPDKRVHACLLLKISGVNSSTLKSYQMNFTETILRKVALSNLNDTLGKNGSGIKSKGGKIDQEADLKATPHVTRSSTDDAKEATAVAKYSSWGWASDFLGAFFGVVVFVVLMITCWLAREEYLRRNKGEDGSGSKRPKRRLTIGNPTYERGRDSSLDLTPLTVLNNSYASPYAVIPCAQVYQSVAENTGAASHTTESSGNNLYDTLKSFSDNILPRRASYKVNSKGTTTASSGTETLYQSVDKFARKCPSQGSGGSVFASLSKSDTTQCSSAKKRSLSEEASSRQVSLPRNPKKKFSSVSDGNFLPSCKGNGQSHVDVEEAKQRLQMDTKKLDKMVSCGGECLNDLTGTCQSNCSSSQKEDENFVINKFATDIPPIPSPRRKLNEESDLGQGRENESRGCLRQHACAKDTFCSSDTIHDNIDDRLSNLEFVMDSDCSEYDETENQLNQIDPFYYVLEGPDPTTLATLV